MNWNMEKFLTCFDSVIASSISSDSRRPAASRIAFHSQARMCNWQTGLDTVYEATHVESQATAFKI